LPRSNNPTRSRNCFMHSETRSTALVTSTLLKPASKLRLIRSLSPTNPASMLASNFSLSS
jgi:hypothetical protein